MIGPAQPAAKYAHQFNLPFSTWPKAILTDGVDIRSYPIAEYRKNIGIALQDPFVLRDCRCLWRLASHREIVAAAEQHGPTIYFAASDGYDVALRRRTSANFNRAGAVDRSANFDLMK
jgi:hypothetical protein